MNDASERRVACGAAAGTPALIGNGEGSGWNFTPISSSQRMVSPDVSTNTRTIRGLIFQFAKLNAALKYLSRGASIPCLFCTGLSTAKDPPPIAEFPVGDARFSRTTMFLQLFSPAASAAQRPAPPPPRITRSASKFRSALPGVMALSGPSESSVEETKVRCGYGRREGKNLLTR